MARIIRMTNKVIPIGPPTSDGSDHDEGYEAGSRGEPKDDTKSPDWKMGWAEAQE